MVKRAARLSKNHYVARLAVESAAKQMQEVWDNLTDETCQMNAPYRQSFARRRASRWRIRWGVAGSGTVG